MMTTSRLHLTCALLAFLVTAPVAGADTLRVASLNLNRLFDDIDNGNREKIETSRKFKRRINTTAVYITRQFKSPHIIALQEVENLNVLAQLASRIRQDGGPEYKPILFQGNDVSGINVGYLIAKKFQINDTRQLFKWHQSPMGPLFSRPPLVARICLESCITFVNLHLRSMRGLKSAKKSRRVNNKRRAQASELARWIDRFQLDHPRQSLMLLGDFNALTPHDEFSDIVGTIIGNPSNRNVRYPAQDLVDPDLMDLTRQIPPPQRYSYTYRGTKQILDYMLVNQNFEPQLKYIRFKEIERSISDHAGLLAEFAW